MAGNQPSESGPRKTFEELARELECDEDEARFEDALRKIAKAPPKPVGEGVDEP